MNIKKITHIALRASTNVFAVALLSVSMSALLLVPVTHAGRANNSNTPNQECDEANIGIVEGVDCAKSEDQQAKLTGQDGLFKTVVNVLLFLIGAVSVIMLIIGGIRYTLSNGDSSQVTAAKNTILYAVIGIIVALLAYAIVNFVVTSFSEGAGGGNGGN